MGGMRVGEEEGAKCPKAWRLVIRKTEIQCGRCGKLMTDSLLRHVKEF